MQESLDDFIKKLEGRLKGRGHPQKIILTSDEARQLIDYAPSDGQTRRLHPVQDKEDQYVVSRKVVLGTLRNIYDSRKRRLPGSSYAAIFFLAGSLFFASFSATGYAVSEGSGAFDVRPLLSIVFLGVSLFMWVKK